MTITHARYIQEYMPQGLVGICFAISHLVAKFAEMLGFYSVRLLPPDDDRQALMETSAWIYVLGLPVLFAFLTTVMLSLLIKYETPAFYLSQRKEMQALKVIRLVYRAPNSQSYE